MIKATLKLLSIVALFSLSACGHVEVNLNQQHSKIWWVAAQTRECHGAMLQQCLLVKKGPNAEWQNFYDPIEGFDYKAGFEYKIRIAITPIEQPMSDGPNRRYTLLDVLRKESVEKD